MNIPLVFWLVPFASVCALAMAWYFFRYMMKEDEGTVRMKEIAGYVRIGAMAYLKQQYKVVALIFVILCLLFAFMAYVLHVQNPWVPFAFLTGGIFSGLCGFFGMKTATYASARTANAVRNSLDRGLRIAFRSGAVMGLVVVGLGLLDIALWFILLSAFYEGENTALVTITTTMLTFGMGASTQALFARVGGGIYTKAADVGADLVGKVEADIPEDDPRNPATIADNVGDNVGDVAGMGADLYESYCGSILSTAALGATAFALNGDMQLKAVIAPMLIAAVGIFLSLAGIFMVRTKEGATMKDLLHSLSLGTNVSACLIAVATFVILYFLDIENWIGVSFSVISGLAAGVIIGAAFGKIVSSLVADIIMPPLGLLIGGIDFKQFAVTLRDAQGDIPAVVMHYGVFIQNVFDFLIVAFAIFMAIKLINKLNRKKEEPAAAPAPTKEEVLLTEIRDLLKEQNNRS